MFALLLKELLSFAAPIKNEILARVVVNQFNSCSVVQFLCSQQQNKKTQKPIDFLSKIGNRSKNFNHSYIFQLIRIPFRN